jgi:type IV secretory pathway VirB10-like protein
LNYRDNYEQHIDEENVEMGNKSFDSRFNVEEQPVSAIPKPFIPPPKAHVNSEVNEVARRVREMEKEVKLDEEVSENDHEKDDENSQQIEDFNSRRQSSVIDYDVSQHDDKESFVAQHVENSAKKSLEKAFNSLEEVKEAVETEEIEGKLKEIEEVFSDLEEIMDEIE